MAKFRQFRVKFRPKTADIYIDMARLSGITDHTVVSGSSTRRVDAGTPAAPRKTSLPFQAVELLDKFFRLVIYGFQSTGNYGLFVPEVLERFGKIVPTEQKNNYDDFVSQEARNEKFGQEKMPDLETIQKIIYISRLSAKALTVANPTIDNLSPDELQEVVSAAPPQALENLIRYFALRGQMNRLKDAAKQEELTHERQVMLGILLRSAALDRNPSLPDLLNLCQELERLAVKGSINAVDILKGQLTKMLEWLSQIDPAIFSADGLSRLIHTCEETGMRIMDQEIIFMAGFIYSEGSVDASLPEAGAAAAALLKLGRAAFRMQNNRANAVKILLDFWKELDIRRMIDSEKFKMVACKMLKGLNLVPNRLLHEMSQREKLDFGKWEEKVISAGIDPAPEPVLPRDTLCDLQVIEIDPEAAILMDRFQKSGRILPFTRNISLEELASIADYGEMVVNGDGVKFFRSGVGVEYMNIVVVMKREFWEAEKDRSILRNIWISTFKGETAPGRSPKHLNPELGVQGNLLIDGVIEGSEEKEKFLLELARNVKYNHDLEVCPSNLPWAEKVALPGQTIAGEAAERYMGFFPQLEVKHDIPLEYIDAILVPEHLYEKALALVGRNPAVAKLLHKVEGTGKDEKEFYAGIDNVRRRSRLAEGMKKDPQFGDKALRKIEEEVLRRALGGDYREQANALFDDHGFFHYPQDGWLWANPGNTPVLNRDRNNDWKIFINPREEKFMEVLGAALKVLSRNKELGAYLKIPEDLDREWRPGRKYGSSSTSPKIVIYANQETLALILNALDCALAELLAEAGFGKEPGPSFTRRFGSTDLVFYKKEYGFNERGDIRVKIAKQAEAAAKAKKIRGEEKILEEKRKALAAAGFEGENYYIRKGEIDPVLF